MNTGHEVFNMNLIVWAVKICKFCQKYFENGYVL